MAQPHNYTQSAQQNWQSADAAKTASQSAGMGSPFQPRHQSQGLNNPRQSSALPTESPLGGPQVMTLRDAATATGALNQEQGGGLPHQPGNWLTQKFQQAKQYLGGGAAAPQLHPQGPLVGIIDTGFAPGEHGHQMLKTIQQGNPDATVLLADSVGKGTWANDLTQFVDVAKASGQSQAVVNLSFDLTQKNPDGTTMTRSELTATERDALLYAQQNGVLVVTSAGNNGGAMSALEQASGRSDNLIVVGAAEGNQRAAYSSFGAGLDFLVGMDGKSTGGTSQAAAETTKTIAGLWAKHPNLAAHQVVQVLEASSVDMGTAGWDSGTGLGLLNPSDVLHFDATTLPANQWLAGLGISPGMGQNLLAESNRWTGREGAIATESANWKMPKLKGPKLSKSQWKELGHTALDVAGFIPVVGAVADGANAAWYAAEGDYANAALSAAAAVPGVGDVAGAAKLGMKGAKAASKAAKAGKGGKGGKTGARGPRRHPDTRADISAPSSRGPSSKGKRPGAAPAPSKTKPGGTGKSAQERRAGANPRPSSKPTTTGRGAPARRRPDAKLTTPRNSAPASRTPRRNPKDGGKAPVTRGPAARTRNTTTTGGGRSQTPVNRADQWSTFHPGSKAQRERTLENAMESFDTGMEIALEMHAQNATAGGGNAEPVPAWLEPTIGIASMMAGGRGRLRSTPTHMNVTGGGNPPRPGADSGNGSPRGANGNGVGSRLPQRPPAGRGTTPTLRPTTVSPVDRRGAAAEQPRTFQQPQRVEQPARDRVLVSANAGAQRDGHNGSGIVASAATGGPGRGSLSRGQGSGVSSQGGGGSTGSGSNSRGPGNGGSGRNIPSHGSGGNHSGSRGPGGSGWTGSGRGGPPSSNSPTASGGGRRSPNRDLRYQLQESRLRAINDGHITSTVADIRFRQAARRGNPSGVQFARQVSDLIRPIQQARWARRQAVAEHTKVERKRPKTTITNPFTIASDFFGETIENGPVNGINKTPFDKIDLAFRALRRGRSQGTDIRPRPGDQVSISRLPVDYFHISLISPKRPAIQKTPGLSQSAHAERLAFEAEILRDPNQKVVSLGVSRPLCQKRTAGSKRWDCPSYFQDTAISTQKTVVLSDPKATWIFYPDGRSPDRIRDVFRRS